MSDARRVTETMLKAGQKECPVDATLSHATLRAIYQAMSAAAPPAGELVRLSEDYDLKALVETYAALHKGKVTAHWLWVAIERIGMGESVQECLRDYGYYYQLDELARLELEITEPYAEVWCPVCEGKAVHDAIVIGTVFGLNWTELDQAHTDISESIEVREDKFDSDVYGVTYRLTDLHHEPGQISFPETGQWDFPPYWEMKLEIVAIERHPDNPNQVRIKEQGDE